MTEFKMTKAMKKYDSIVINWNYSEYNRYGFNYVWFNLLNIRHTNDFEQRNCMREQLIAVREGWTN